jgi:superfamily II helicase
MQKHLQKQITPTAQLSNLCPKCDSELHVSWCARCFGTGRSGKHKCKKCAGTGMTTACPNVRSHKLGLFEIAAGLCKRLAEIEKIIEWMPAAGKKQREARTAPPASICVNPTTRSPSSTVTSPTDRA